MEMENLSPEEIRTLNELQAKQKRIQRARKKDEAFMLAVDRRKDEILARWGYDPMSDISHYWSDIKTVYGCNDDDKLFQFVTREKAINVFKERNL